jgi:hypothetical protein
VHLKSLAAVVALASTAAFLAMPPANAAPAVRQPATPGSALATSAPLSPALRAVPSSQLPTAILGHGRTPRPLVSGSSRARSQHAVPAATRIPAGDSLVSVPGGGAASLRYDGCLTEDFAPQNPYAPYDPCGINATVGNGSYVIMRCWTDDEAPISENPNWTSPRWFYVTADTGNPEDNVSGFIYSDLVADQVKTPNCGGTFYDEPYPFQPSQASIGIYDTSNGVLTIDMNDVATGPAGVYCHVGSSGYPTGGTVTYLGQYTIDDNETIGVPICGTGTQWVGIDASDGIVRYTGAVTIGSSQPPPTPGYLGGIGGEPLTFDTTDGYVVGSSITVTGYPAENFGQTDVTVANLALAATSPNGSTYEAVCYTNLTVAPGQIIYCAGSFTPNVAGTWELNLDWQGGDGNWHHLYEPLDVQIAAAPPPPANDNFGSAEDITGWSSFSGTNVGATAQAGEPDHYLGFPAQNSVWFKFTAARSGRAWLKIDTKTDVTALAAYTGTKVAHLTRLATWDALGAEVIAFKVTKGHVYHFAVDDDYGYYPGTTFSGTFVIRPDTAPANDNFGRAQPISTGRVYQTAFANATTQRGEPAAWPGEADYGSVWYSVRPSKDITMTFSSPSSSDPVVIGLFTGKTLTSLKRLDYDWLGKKGRKWTVALSAGKKYRIAVDNYYDPQDQISGIPPTLRFELKAIARNAAR